MTLLARRRGRNAFAELPLRPRRSRSRTAGRLGPRLLIGLTTIAAAVGATRTFAVAAILGTTAFVVAALLGITTAFVVTLVVRRLRIAVVSL